MNCIICNTPLTGIQKKYCSKVCSRKAELIALHSNSDRMDKKHKRDSLRGERKDVIEYHKQYSKKAYKERQIKNNEGLSELEIKIRRNKKSCAIYISTCIVCGKISILKSNKAKQSLNYCSDHILGKAMIGFKHIETERLCIHCGDKFIGKTISKLCPICVEREDKINKRLFRRKCNVELRRSFVVKNLRKHNRFTIQQLREYPIFIEIQTLILKIKRHEQHH